MPVAVLFYDVVLFVHVTAIVVAFGVTFAYPILGTYVARNHPRAVPALHEAQVQVGNRLIAPAGTVALLAGFYLAHDRDYFGEPWVIVPMVILIGLLVAGGAFFSPTERRAAELAARDVGASGEKPVEFSPEYEAVQRRIAAVGAVASLSVVIALYFMIAKPFA